MDSIPTEFGSDPETQNWLEWNLKLKLSQLRNWQMYNGAHT